MDAEKSVGTILREARLARGLSLAEVEKGTSIRSRYLEAVENDEYDKAPGDVFVKGMIRNYGNYLGLNGPELVDMYKASAAGVTASAVRSAGIREVERVRLNIQLKDPRDVGSGTGSMQAPLLKQCLAGLAVVLLLVAGYFAVPRAINYFSGNMSQVTLQAEEKALAEKEKLSPQTEAATDKVQVEMEANGSCWLEVNADGREIYAGMLQPGDKRSYEAKERLIIKYGNIGVMKLTVNGESVDLKGEQGVAVKTYTRLKQE